MKSARRKMPVFCGVIHLPPLPGSFRSARELRSGGGSPARALDRIAAQALSEARQLEKLGFDAVVIENFGDTPFCKDRVAPETLASLAILAKAVRSSVRIPLGINVLRNDAESALAIAAVTGAQFIRVNVLSGVAATDQGWIEGRAAELLSLREKLDPSIGILADVWVKHARQFSSDSLSHSIEETFFRAGADAIIVTGATTGRLAPQELLDEAVDACEAHGIPLYLGSGVSSASLEQLPRDGIAGILVGSDLKKNGIAGGQLDVVRSRRWLQTARKHFGN